MTGFPDLVSCAVSVPAPPKCGRRRAAQQQVVAIYPLQDVVAVESEELVVSMTVFSTLTRGHRRNRLLGRVHWSRRHSRPGSGSPLLDQSLTRSPTWLQEEAACLPGSRIAAYPACSEVVTHLPGEHVVTVGTAKSPHVHRC
jgi:hypothetical protein